MMMLPQLHEVVLHAAAGNWWLPAVHACITWALVGLIWTIQLVHYPLFAAVGRKNFAKYEQQHTRRITVLVMPLMLAELGTAAILAAAGAGGVGSLAGGTAMGQQHRTPEVAASGGIAPQQAGLALLCVIWGSTALVQVPCHTSLEQHGFGAWHDACCLPLVTNSGLYYEGDTYCLIVCVGLWWLIRADMEVHRRLVRSNWIRTVAWSLRGLLAMIMVAKAPPPT
jgi:hypothetical protein|eukprot:COSAG01_NODE_754_length_13831_cov_35.287795_3_plen_225_part_00